VAIARIRKASLGESRRPHYSLKFSAFLRDERELHPRTVYNKFENVMSFLKVQGFRGLVGKNDWPRYVEEEPEVYEREELDTLFAVCDQQEKLWFEFFLMTGMREQEVMHCCWDDINLTRGTVTVRYKPEYGFSPKSYREREIPIPVRLVKELQAFKMKSDKTCGLVFPTSGCNPKQNFLDDLKACAEGSSRRRISGCTSFALRLRHGHCGRGLICEPCSSGSATLTWRARCVI
jgi:integrase